MVIRVDYTDGSQEHYDSIKSAQNGIQETVTGCDFAATVHNIEVIKSDAKSPPVGTQLFCNWTVELKQL